MGKSAKVALITGAGTGVGRSVALRFAREGIGVAVNYRRSEKEAQETVAEVKKLGVPALLCQADVSDDGAVKKMVARCQAELGGLDILVNNAAITRFIDHTKLDELTDQIWHEIMGVNLMGAFYCSRAALPLLQERQGVIVNVSSVAGLSGQGSSIPYCASKAALNSLTRSLARAFGPKVRVNGVAPGPILTRWLEGRDEQVQRFAQAAPLGRAASPEDIAEVVAFLALGGELMTGQILVVDAGRTI